MATNALDMVGVPGAVNTLKQSAKFMKRLVAIGFSQILYLRSSIPEECFKSYSDGRLDLKLLKEKSESPAANKLAAAMKNAMSAFDLGYLKELVLVVVNDKNCLENIIEKYTFGFKKMETGEDAISRGFSVNFASPRSLNQSIDVGAPDIDHDALHEATKDLLVKLIQLIQGQDALPKPAFMTIVIEYHEDTPTDYQPPGFCPNSDALSRACATKTKSKTIGKMKTKFHGVGFQVSNENLRESSTNEKENSNSSEHQTNLSVIDMAAGLDVTSLEPLQMSENEVSHNSEIRKQKNDSVANGNATTSNLSNPRLKSNSAKGHASRASREGDAMEEPVDISKSQTPVNAPNPRLKSNSAKGHASRPSRKGDAMEEPVDISKSQTPVTTHRSKIPVSDSHGSLNSTARSPKALIPIRKSLSVKDTFTDESNSNVKASKYHTMIPF